MILSTGKFGPYDTHPYGPQHDVSRTKHELFGGKTIILDATLRSPLSGDGVPRPGAAVTRGVTFPGALADKRRVYPELFEESNRHVFKVVASELGGTCSDECFTLLRSL